MYRFRPFFRPRWRPGMRPFWGWRPPRWGPRPPFFWGMRWGCWLLGMVLLVFLVLAVLVLRSVF